MGNNLALVQFIKFALNSLGDENGHHEFEHIAYAFARHRLATNLLPPTGPVSAGGDQGRDGESFWSDLSGSINTSVGKASVSNVPMVLACTTQTSGVPSKIKEDLVKISGSGSPVGRVAYFTVAPIPVAKRHELIADAVDAFDIALEIFDAQAIAENLADDDLFWVAEHYLKIPADMQPAAIREQELPEWYLRDRALRRSADWAPALGIGEFVSLKDLARWALFEDDARSDLGDWLAQLATLAQQSPFQNVRLRSLYELAVLLLRSSGNFTSANPYAVQFSNELDEANADPSMLEDASTLLRYCYGSWLRRETTYSYSDLDEIYRRLDDAVALRLDASPAPNARASLLALRTNLSLMPVYPADAQASPEDRDFYDKTRANRSHNSIPLPVSIPVRDLDRAMQTIDAILEHLPQAPMFPITSVARLFESFTLTVSGHTGYSKVSQALDVAVGEQAGAATQAASARKRASLFLDAGKYLLALNEVHAAKISWWPGDNLHESIRMMQLAARIYTELGFHLAAKQHALMAATVALSSPDPDLAPLVPQSLSMAVRSDYEAGQWLTGNATVYVAALAHASHAENPQDLGNHDELEAALIREAVKLKVARQSFLEYVPYLESNLARAQLLDLVNEMMSEVESIASSIEEMAAYFDASGSSRPFSDAGTTRQYGWWFQGQQWVVDCDNDRLRVLATERIVAAIQILQVELATDDCLWIPGTVNLHVDIRSESDNRDKVPVMAPGTTGWKLLVEPMAVHSDEDFFFGTSALVASLLGEFTLLPDEEFRALFERAWKNGAGHEISSGRPYDECANYLRGEDYGSMAALAKVELFASVPRTAASKGAEISAPKGLHRIYNRSRSLELIQARYDNAEKITRHTMKRILHDEPLMEKIELQRSQGWLDWHLLLAIANAVANRRVRVSGLNPANVAHRHRIDQLMRADENERESIDPQVLFTDIGLESIRDVAMASVLAGYGLRMPTGLTEMDAIYGVLGERFAFFSDDVAHRDPFVQGQDA